MNEEKRFNPYKMFVGAFIPNCLLQLPDLSAVAKLCYARLSQYAGKDGECYPSMATLGNEIGVSKRNIFRIIKELEDYKLIKRISRQSSKGDKISSVFIFLEHDIYTTFVTTPSAQDVTTPSAESVITGSADLAYHRLRESGVKKETSLQPEGCDAPILKPHDPVEPATPQRKPRSEAQQRMDKVLDGFMYAAGVSADDPERIEAWRKTEIKKWYRSAKELLDYFNGDTDKCLNCTQAIVTALRAQRLTWTPAAICRWKVDWDVQIKKNGQYSGLGEGSENFN